MNEVSTKLARKGSRTALLLNGHSLVEVAAAAGLATSTLRRYICEGVRDYRRARRLAEATGTQDRMLLWAGNRQAQRQKTRSVTKK